MKVEFLNTANITVSDGLNTLYKRIKNMINFLSPSRERVASFRPIFCNKFNSIIVELKIEEKRDHKG